MDNKKIYAETYSKIKLKIGDDINQLFSDEQIIPTIKEKLCTCFECLASYLGAVSIFIVYKLTSINEKINELKANNKSQGELTFSEIKNYVNKKNE